MYAVYSVTKSCV